MALGTPAARQTAARNLGSDDAEQEFRAWAEEQRQVAQLQPASPPPGEAV